LVAQLGIAGIGDGALIGAGGSAVVFAARTEDGTPVAAKLLRISAVDERARKQFDREAAALKRLSAHELIVPVLGTGITDRGEPYLLMPLLEGSAQQAIDDHGPLPWREALSLILLVCDAIDFAHSKNVIHRDIKPANILLDAQGRPYVADFGIAKLVDETQAMSSQVAATPSFAPPERFRGDAASRQSDVYSLGATYYALVNGKPPFTTGQTESPEAVMRRVLDETPIELAHAELGVPGPVSDVITRAMSKQPTDRPQSAWEFAKALKHAAASRYVDATEHFTMVLPSNSTTDLLPSAPGSASEPPSQDHVATETFEPAPPKRQLRWPAVLALVAALAVAYVSWDAIRSDDPAGTPDQAAEADSVESSEGASGEPTQTEAVGTQSPEGDLDSDETSTAREGAESDDADSADTDDRLGDDESASATGTVEDSAVTVVSVLETQQDNVGLFFELVADRNLEELTGRSGPFTVLAPLDASLDAEMMVELESDERTADAFVLRHVVAGVWPIESLQSESVVQPLAGSEVAVERSDLFEVLFDGASGVAVADLEADDGIVHVVTGPLQSSNDESDADTTPSEDSEESCPVGFTTAGNQCTRVVDAVVVAGIDRYRCPSGSDGSPTVSSPTCVESATENVQPVSSTLYSCPQGAAASGSGSALSCSTSGSETLTVTRLSSVSYSCASGATLSGSTCTSATTQQVSAVQAASTTSYSCPAGYTREQQTCTSRPPYYLPPLLTPGTTTYSCPSGSTASGSGANLTCTTVKTVTEAATCTSNQVTEASGGCTAIPTAGNNFCDSLQRCPVTPPSNCSSGFIYVPSTQMCSRTAAVTVDRIETTSPVTYSCPSDTDANGPGADLSCAAGTIETIAATETTTPGAFSCPSGATGNPTASNPFCSQTSTNNDPATATTTYSCPNGYTQAGSGASTTCTQQVTNNTTVTRLETTDYSCPTGTTSSGSGSGLRCTRTTSATVGAIRTVVADQYLCPPGTEGTPTSANSTCIETR